MLTKKLMQELREYCLPKNLVKNIEEEYENFKKQRIDNVELRRQNKELREIMYTVEHDSSVNFMFQKGILDASIEELKTQKPDIEKILRKLNIVKKATVSNENIMGLLTYLEITKEELRKKSEEIVLGKFVCKRLEENFLDIPKREAEILISSEIFTKKFYTNPHALNNIIANLIGNARKYSLPYSKIMGRISLEKDRFNVEIENRILEGSQLSHEELKRIFEKGYRKESEIKGHGKNRGFGLYVVRKNLERGFEGSIEAKSDHQTRVQKQKGDEKLNFGNIDYDIGALENTPLFYVKAVIPEFKN